MIVGVEGEVPMAGMVGIMGMIVVGMTTILTIGAETVVEVVIAAVRMVAE